ncbi:MAG TPA: hypothetical protein VMW27_01995 [Thermoanaerobaculia bacterium]|nr:hypothetical protein [Thermoanaerobaculia bacterium]
MSLISEALKKARQEAARQDALHQSAPYAVGYADARARRNPLLPVLAGLGAGCLFAGLLFAVAWTAGWGPFAKSPAPAPVEVAQSAPAPPPPAVQIQEEPAAPQAAVPAPPQQVPAAPPPQPAIVEPRPLPGSPKPPAADPETPIAQAEPSPPPVAAAAEPTSSGEPAAVPPAEPAPSTPAPLTAPAGGLEDGKVYTGEVPVPGGGSLKLNGIAYSQDRPVAVLDGRVMGPGEAIQGFTVVAIESGRVKLQGYGATVFLSPR